MVRDVGEPRNLSVCPGHDNTRVITASFLGIDADSWSLIITALALVVALDSATCARGAEARADRVAGANVASARAAERPAGAANKAASSEPGGTLSSSRTVQPTAPTSPCRPPMSIGLGLQAPCGRS